jgi:uncharacterized protein YfiM (DUF2279 family)
MVQILLKNIYLLLVLDLLSVQAEDFYQPLYPDTGHFFSSCSRQKRYLDRWISEDKAMHVIGSFVSTIFINQVSMRSYEQSRNRSNQISASFVFTLGLLKEMSDHRKKNNFFSWKDLTANILGITLAIIVSTGEDR